MWKGWLAKFDTTRRASGAQQAASRRPLRRQFLWPMVGVMVIAAAAGGALNAYLSARRTKAELEERLEEVVQTLARSNFRLTDGVLRQTRGLSGAEFLVADRKGQPLAASNAMLRDADLAFPVDSSADQQRRITLSRRVAIDGRSYFHTAALLHRPAHADSIRLHLFYPEERYRAAWRQAVIPPLLVGAVTLLATALLAAAVAARVTRPIGRLQHQVARIAQGDFQPLPVADRNDELRDLATAVNHMASMLSQYEQEVRRSERLKTLDQLAAGVAHQLRNAITGCKMALDLYQREQLTVVDKSVGSVRSDGSVPSESESLQVAQRQLILMEQYVQRFLTLGAGRSSRPQGDSLDGRPDDTPEDSLDRATVDLRALIEDVVSLVEPTARHLGVRIDCDFPPVEPAAETPVWVRGDEHQLGQVVVNLLLNAVEAVSPTASQGATAASQGARAATVDATLTPPECAIRVRLEHRDGRATCSIADPGPGPAKEIRDQIFEPLVTNKSDGAGLGLAVAREVVERHRGVLRWERQDGWTCFVFELPLMKSFAFSLTSHSTSEAAVAETTGC